MCERQPVGHNARRAFSFGRSVIRGTTPQLNEKPGRKSEPGFSITDHSRLCRRKDLRI